MSWLAGCGWDSGGFAWCGGLLADWRAMIKPLAGALPIIVRCAWDACGRRVSASYIGGLWLSLWCGLPSLCVVSSVYGLVVCVCCLLPCVVAWSSGGRCVTVCVFAVPNSPFGSAPVRGFSPYSVVLNYNYNYNYNYLRDSTRPPL